jgi:hypothetical protein
MSLGLAVALITAEAGGAYFGGWGRGHITHEGIMRGCTGCIFVGSTYFWADAGDTLNVSYDVEITEGTLQMWFVRMTPGNLGDLEGRTRVEYTGAGSWRAPISRRGWYHLVVDADSERGSTKYDMSFSLRWWFDRS